jgi:5-methyltetrahydropteroyltriglutamate--homocysteine methyltransferase
MPLRTTVVGSWWKLDEHEDALRRYHAGELGDEEGEQLLNTAAAAAIKEQQDLGLDEWTGGEYFTDNFIDHMQRVLHGIEIDKPDEPDPFDYDDLAHAQITGEISAPDGLGYARNYERESKLPGGVRKATVVGPLEIAVHAADQQEELQRQMPNLIGIVNRELRDLAALGCPHVQLDVPIFGGLVTNGLMTAEQAAGVIAGCLEGVEGSTRGVHICNGNFKGRPISPTVSNAAWVEIFQHLDGVVDVAAMECSYFAEWQGRDAWAALPQSIALAAGIVDEASYGIETVKKVRDRAADWARVVGEERLWISPSCGFGRHPARTRPVLQAKLEHMAEAARTF